MFNCNRFLGKIVLVIYLYIIYVINIVECFCGLYIGESFVDIEVCEVWDGIFFFIIVFIMFFLVCGNM